MQNTEFPVWNKKEIIIVRHLTFRQQIVNIIMINTAVHKKKKKKLLEKYKVLLLLNEYGEAPFFSEFSSYEMNNQSRHSQTKISVFYFSGITLTLISKCFEVDIRNWKSRQCTCTQPRTQPLSCIYMFCEPIAKIRVTGNIQ